MKRNMFNKFRDIGVQKIVRSIIVGIVIALLFSFLFGSLIQFLWNVTLVEIFDLQKISYWQGVGLLLLSRILVGGMGGHGPGSSEKCKSWRERWCSDDAELLKEKVEEV